MQTYKIKVGELSRSRDRLYAILARLGIKSAVQTHIYWDPKTSKEIRVKSNEQR